MRDLKLHAARASRLAGIALALTYFGLCVLWVKGVPVSWNDISRAAAIESLASRGTWAIDESPWFELTQDKVLLDGKYYSDKMPLLSWLAAGAYQILQRAGMSLTPGCALCAYPYLTLVFVSAPGAVMIGLMYSFARARGVPVGPAVLGTLALGLGTMVLPYSLVLNHGLPAAVCLFAAYYLLMMEHPKKEVVAVGAGFFAALAVTFEPFAAILAAALLVVSLVRFRAQTTLFLLGALPPLFLTGMLDFQITGSILPPYFLPGGYAYPGSVFPATIGGNGVPDDPIQYAFKMLLGAQGLFAYNPLLLPALLGVLIAALTPGHALRASALSIGIGFILLCIYLGTRTGNLGGEAYGERWFVQAVPLLMAFLFFAPPLSANLNPGWRWLSAPLFAAVLMVSMLSTYQGTKNPWHYVPPPAHPTRNSQTGEIGWRWEVPVPWR